MQRSMELHGAIQCHHLAFSSMACFLYSSCHILSLVLPVKQESESKYLTEGSTELHQRFFSSS
jgi:hypothetical protein